MTSASSVAKNSASASSRLSDADALAMYHELSIHELGKLALARLSEMHPEPYRTYVVDRNINYSNVCTAKCIFCNFKTDPGKPDAYILSYEQIGEKIQELIEIGGTQILMQGGLVPALDVEPASNRTSAQIVEPASNRTSAQIVEPASNRTSAQIVEPAISRFPQHTLPFDWYLDLLRFIRKNYPTIHIHAFSPPEIWAFAQVYRMPLRDVLLRLQDAGLATIPGGGGEILVDRVRRKIGQGKTLSAEWLEVMRQAHKIGMQTSCTMMMGHIETIEERIEHLRVLRDLQDETGGFTAFIHWPFQPEGTKLGRWKRLPLDQNRDRKGAREGEAPAEPAERHEGTKARRHEGENVAAAADPSHVPTFPRSHGNGAEGPQFTKTGRPLNDGKHLLLADGHEYLTWLAIARLYLDNIPNIQSSWVTMGPKVGQLALFYGANDMGSVMMEENVVSQAGATYRLDEGMIRRLITDAGWQPQQRDQYYRPVETERKRRPLPVA